MVFWILIFILGVVVFPVFRRQLARRCKLTYWESACITFSLLFCISAFFPIIGAPLVHPVRGEILFEETVIQTAFFPAVMLFAVGCFLVLRRKILDRESFQGKE